MIGKTISHYTILAKVGEGGMGVVYKAEDTRLKRTVALKFLAPQITGSGEEKARFLREAQAAAALDHPNICTIYEIDEAEGRTFMAMAFLEGHELKEKVAAGPLKLGEALDVALQVAQGLREAHRKGVVHRDIKPANIMVDDKGPTERQVKILDFGLAQLAGRSRLTQADTTMGTVAYMSPEQTQGREVDHRADVWALGVVLYEMVTGVLPFKGEYDQAVMYSILNEDHEPITAVRAGVPMDLEWIAGKALAKSPEERYQHVEELIVDLSALRTKISSGRATILQSAVRTAQSTPTGVPAAPLDAGTGGGEGVRREPPQAPGAEPLARQSPAAGFALASGPGSATQIGQAVTPAKGLLAASWELARQAVRTLWRADIELIRAHPQSTAKLIVAGKIVFMAALIVIVAMWFRWPEPQPGRLMRFALNPGNGAADPAVSPDGRQIAYVAGEAVRTLWIQDLDRDEPRELAGTEGAQNPFWSPAGDRIAFSTGQEVKVISTQGGSPLVLCEMEHIIPGGAWTPDSSAVVFSAAGRNRPPRLYQVSDRGGAPALLFDQGAPRMGGFWTPSFLPAPDGRRIVLFANGHPPKSQVMVRDLDSGQQHALGEGNHPFYSPTGHVLYQTSLVIGGLWALPFSTETLQPTGEAFPIAQNVWGPSTSKDGTLVYQQSPAGSGFQLVWRDRRGERLGVVGQPQDLIFNVSISPDGDRVLVSSVEKDNHDIWVHDIARSLKSRLTFHPEPDIEPVWSPGGDRVAFATRGRRAILTTAADGGGEAEVLAETDGPAFPTYWSADGKYLLYYVHNRERGRDLWYLRREAGEKGYQPVPFLQTPFDQDAAQLSPDSRYIAYVSDESGRPEVYVRPFPEGSGRWQVSTSGGAQPRWNKNGKELVYVEGDTLLAVAVSREPEFSVGAAERLFPSMMLAYSNETNYDLSADGQRVIVPELLGGETPGAIRVVLNWFEEFRGRAGAK